MARRGVPVKYTHNWSYRGHWRETKISPRDWNVDFRATKRTKAGGAGPPPGFRVKWKIDAVQYARKTGKGTYETRLVGRKRLLSSS